MSPARRASRRLIRAPRALALSAARAGLRALSGRNDAASPAIEALHIVLSPHRPESDLLWHALRQLPVEGVFLQAHTLCGPELPEWTDSPFPTPHLVQMNELHGRTWERIVVHRHVLGRVGRASGISPGPIRIVSAVREPVSQLICALFDIAHRHPEVLDARSLTVETVTRYLTGDLRIVYPWLEPGPWWDQDRWIGRELEARLGLCVFGSPFDRRRGWQVYDGADARLLIIREETMSSVQDALGEYYGLPPSRVSTAPDGGDKSASCHLHYQSVRSAIRLPEALLDCIYSTKLVRHFYTEAEIERFKERWRE